MSVGEKCNWQHLMAHPRKPLYRRKNLPTIYYASRVIAHFVPNFVAMATGVGRGKMQSAAFDGPFPKTPLEAQKSHKNLLRKPSYSPFCPKFRCHSNGGRSGKNANSSVRWLIPEKPPYRRKNLAKNLLRKPSYSQFCPKFRCHGNGGRSGKNAIGSIQWPIPENPSRGAKISQKSHKNLLRKPSYSQFCPKFRCHGNGGRLGKNAIGSIRWPILEKSPIGAKISQKSLTQAEL